MRWLVRVLVRLLQGLDFRPRERLYRVETEFASIVCSEDALWVVRDIEGVKITPLE